MAAPKFYPPDITCARIYPGNSNERLVAEHAQILKEDEGKGFFTGMGKKRRETAEKELDDAKGYVAAGQAVLEDLNQREADVALVGLKAMEG